MAVYTKTDKATIKALLSGYDIGKLVDYKEIAEGVENSNFLLQTDQDKFILTIYEKRINKAELPFFIDLKTHLTDKNFPCPKPIKDSAGKVIQNIQGKPAAIVSFLQGKGIKNIQNEHVLELGKAMAELHVATEGFKGKRKNDLGLKSWKSLFTELEGKISDQFSPELAAQIKEHMLFLEREWPDNLPSGIIHADLFPDNVFFEDKKLTGVIDFYFACNDAYIYDLAICLNAWCFERHNEFNITKAKLMLSEYNKVRPLSQKEIDILPVVTTGAAMRFFLTRMYDWLHQVEGAVVVPKNPIEYWERLCFHKGLTKASAYGI